MACGYPGHGTPGKGGSLDLPRVLVPVSPPAMADVRLRVPMKPGYFTVPDDAAAAPEVICSRCQDCGEYFFPQRLVCAKCLSRRTVETKVPARGTLYSFFVHMPLFGSMRIEHMEGYGVGQVDLPEGPRLQVPLAGKQEQFRVGMPLLGELEALREENGKDVVIIRFRPAES
jgi:uncharacterized OB-fold protein